MAGVDPDLIVDVSQRGQHVLALPFGTSSLGSSITPASEHPDGFPALEHPSVSRTSPRSPRAPVHDEHIGIEMSAVCLMIEARIDSVCSMSRCRLRDVYSPCEA